MKKTLTIVWIIVAVNGMASVDVCAEMRRWENDRVDFSAVAEGEAGGENHYILQCGERCVRADTAAIGKPTGIATDAYGNVYFSGRSIVYKVDAGGYITRVAGNGTRGFSGDGGPARDALLDIPFDKYKEIVADFIDFDYLIGGLAVDALGNLYIADSYNNRVRKVDASGIITTIAGKGDPGHPNSTTDYLFGWPQGVAVDAGGNLYVSSAWGALLKRYPDGTISLESTANCGHFLDPGFCSPKQIAVDAAGNVYVPDVHCRVRKVSADGTMVTIAGDERPSRYFVWTCGYSGDGGPAIGAALSEPHSVAVDAMGNIYIADTNNRCVRKVDGDGNIVTVAGKCAEDIQWGDSSYSGDGGPATAAQLDRPFGVAVDRAGNLFIADTYNYRVRMVTPDGIITTIAGNGEPANP
jgi:sugar lactone lactonase YvrE